MQDTPSTLTQRAISWLGIAVGAMVSLWVFSLYAHPEFMRGVTDMVWGCF
jgi:hypothetical protein